MISNMAVPCTIRGNSVLSSEDTKRNVNVKPKVEIEQGFNQPLLQFFIDTDSVKVDQSSHA